VRLGLFGGTFDPPHVGHWLAASDAYELLSLDRLVFVPAAQQPLKQGRVSAPPEERVAMLRLMLQGDPRFEIDEIEIDRRGLSFTVDTLEEYAKRFPDAIRFLCVGADALALFEAWREPARIMTLARLAVLVRGEGVETVPEIESLRNRLRVVGGAGALEPEIVPSRRVDVSSSEIRERVRAGKTIRGFVADAVAAHIGSRGLYQQGSA
jgi:nicotinate-nucleotide adenylyltransferase